MADVYKPDRLKDKLGYFDGYIAEALYFDRVLSSAERQQLFNGVEVYGGRLICCSGKPRPSKKTIGQSHESHDQKGDLEDL